MKNSSKGYTLIELLIVMAIIAIIATIVVVIPLGIMNNAFYTEAGVERTLKNEKPEIVRVVDSHRNIINYSQVTAVSNSGEKVKVCLDTDVLFNYEFPPCED